ncbi:uncharacterized protein G2W53_018188 [Senna tora]|uniref:Uncharacterized protein n=1 Tax=Senna tora TaxID=362788 RepID=A0A834U040_9FABA|nr:uncharacterized protein G2W53_018188 [Senna tora]
MDEGFHPSEEREDPCMRFPKRVPGGESPKFRREHL